MGRFVSCLLASLLFLIAGIEAFPYEASLVDWNLNQNVEATDSLEYWGEWENHTYTPSPDNWRMPTYTVALDRYANGDPSNDDANGTQFEHDWMSNQFRFGGDARGLINDLDYIHGMGIGTIYIMGSPFMNQPWQSDSYSPLDFTVLDQHHGRLQDWRDLIDAIHERGMYVLLDNTMATMGDLIGFKGSLNSTAAFTWDEYDYEWKSDRTYVDFTPGNSVVDCTYPRMWTDDGWPLTVNQTACRDSEFDQYGDSSNTGNVLVYENELSKYGSVQDRLRDWRSDVLDKIKHFSCMQIAMLDIDGFRMDKAIQTTIDSMASFADYQRQCARQYGKENFYIVGEVVATDAQAAIYIGRGKQPDMYFGNATEAAMASNTTDSSSYIRNASLSALDGAGFQYIIYGAMTRFLGLDGQTGFQGVDFVELWESMAIENDLVNANTGKFDPRHIIGMTSQDVFRWTALKNGTEKQLLGQFITTLEVPGTPALYWGEEQSLYIIDSTASNYLYGRQPMSSNRAWQLHGCYHLGDAALYGKVPDGPGLTGCHDDSVSLDHKDPSHPVRNVVKRMYELRQQYPVLNDGYHLEALSNQTTDEYLPGSEGIPSPMGLWSVWRSQLQSVQNLEEADDNGNQGVWLVFSNLNETKDFIFECQDENAALVSPFTVGTTVKNLLYPYEEYVLENSTATLDRNGVTGLIGCLSNLTMDPWGYKALVPKDKFVDPAPSLTGVVPSHDERLTATVSLGEQQTIPVEFHFSHNMSCDSVTSSLSVNSTTSDGTVARINNASVTCVSLDVADDVKYVGQPATVWKFSADLENVSHGIHTLTISNASTTNGAYTNAVDRFMFRLGTSDNPVVFPQTGNYSTSLLHRIESTGDLYISQRAPGADKYRYSLTWGSSWSNWTNYTGGNVTLQKQPWSGTAKQKWDGEHVIVQYWSQMAGSADHMQHGDLVTSSPQQPRRWPHAFVFGSWNTWGYDDGLANSMRLTSPIEDYGNATGSNWVFDIAAEWPTHIQVNVWGMNPDGLPDKTMEFGDVDDDGVLDWLHPDTLAKNVINITSGPGMPHIGWRLLVNDGNYNYRLVPTGSGWYQLALSLLLALVPLLTSCLAIWVFKRSYYQVKFNQVGIADAGGFWGRILAPFAIFRPKTIAQKEKPMAAAAAASQTAQRTVLIATMEYEIDDWNIKIKIGGLGKMASLMGSSALGHQNLIWVVPCVGGIDYPTDTVAEPMVVTINNAQYVINVQYHILRNMTFVLLDAPIFRAQSKADPYPARMDDIESAIYYSAWNACIAETIKRFPVDLYHINDYHGALAPLYLLPNTIPVSLSLHNAEFQGMWSLRTKGEMEEISAVFNLPKEVVKMYVQFDKVFNMLYAAASYIRQHQGGYGAVGVSKKYGTRAYKRYPIFWGLNEIGSLPNPDPDDMAALDAAGMDKEIGIMDVAIDEEAEERRGELRMQAQKWAGLDVNPNAQLFVFVGRWSLQKGIDLIADVFPAIMDKHKDVQLICIGPTIDNHGKFAALKLQKIMDRYPGRVYSKPEFTQIPPYVFSGAEFALMPSRDEPFGLVAVEFGRKGALCVGSRVGGLGQMPGWWFTIESTETKHLLRQFKSTINAALASSQETRRVMRARSLVQRFPVMQWVLDLDILQNRSIEAHDSVRRGSTLNLRMSGSRAPSGTATPVRPPLPNSTLPNTPQGTVPPSPMATAPNTAPSSAFPSRPGSRAPSPTRGFLKREPSSWSIKTASEVESGAATPRYPYMPRTRSSSGLGKLLTNRLDGLAEMDRTTSQMERGENEKLSESPEPDASRSSGGNDQQTIVDQSLHSGLPTATQNQSVLTLDTVVGGRSDFKLQNVEPFFNDPKGEYYNAFSQLLDSHKGTLSSDKLCVEEYIRSSEKNWFARFHDAKLGKTPKVVVASVEFSGQSDDGKPDNEGANEFNLSPDYKPPTGLKKLMLAKIGDWPVYAFLLALGQIIAANSYQVTLLTGQNGQSAMQVYITSGVYLGASIFWWIIFRTCKLFISLSLAFFFYGAAFFVLGMIPFATTSLNVTALQYVATALYAVASASGFLFFTQNFLTEGGNPVRSWMFRACTIQGTQQIYIAALWFWGSYASKIQNQGGKLITSSSRTVTCVTVPIAFFLWAICGVLFVGLPDAYRSKPGYVSAFYRSLVRRKIVVWFLVVAVIQNYFLSAPYGRSWSYLWGSSVAPYWAVALLAILFFGGIWAIILAIMAHLSKEHSWALPLFAIGLGAPRWAQMLWGTSSIGLYLPWAGSNLSGALLGRVLWLWLGVLDALQGVGFGMILLQTLGRFHVSWTVFGAQVVGSLATIAARASAPDKIGPGSVFPNLAMGLWEGVNNVWLWVPLVLQLLVCVGFFVFFRKEQLFKP
ncbi:Cell wall alpha-1,3-glucan synthase mok13 [Cytospora mali]|uniref:alpha-1,3-glucan synthase n=1 Tax=Cytospora mali TaxID=578113 RepID=A0A194VT20_CYTMA|nr:Cell wall alpha-1,3-glucan synthase mok13 [Valsa mali]